MENIEAIKQEDKESTSKSSQPTPERIFSAIETIKKALEGFNLIAVRHILKRVNHYIDYDTCIDSELEDRDIRFQREVEIFTEIGYEVPKN